MAAHPATTTLFTEGQAASANLQLMAEGGDISSLKSDLTGVGATLGNPALSVVAMILPTNDDFTGLSAITIPKTGHLYLSCECL